VSVVRARRNEDKKADWLVRLAGPDEPYLCQTDSQNREPDGTSDWRPGLVVTFSIERFPHEQTILFNPSEV
jgi:hypothetical protein